MEQENQFKIPEGLIGISEVYLPVEIIFILFSGLDRQFSLQKNS